MVDSYGAEAIQSGAAANIASPASVSPANERWPGIMCLILS